jgi:hypothetical protein
MPSENMTDLVHRDGVENADALLKIFGAWPSFHDAEVHSLVISREQPEAPRIDARIHVFVVTAEIDSSGHHTLVNHRFVTLQFFRVASLELSGFNEQNALFALTIEPGDPSASEPRRWDISFDSSYGVSAAFSCDRIVVGEVEPYIPAA